MNVVMTGDGRFVEVQGTAEGEPFDRLLLDRAARPGRLRAAPSSPRIQARALGVTALVVLATRNAHKVDELRRILGDAGLAVELLTVADFDGVLAVPEVAETGVTFAENALLKARRGAFGDRGCRASPTTPGSASTCWTGCRGSSRRAGRGGTATTGANLELVLAQLADVPDEHLGASFVCAAALARPDGTEVVVEGRWPGRLVRVPRGHQRVRLRPDLRARGRAADLGRALGRGQGRDQPPRARPARVAAGHRPAGRACLTAAARAG